VIKSGKFNQNRKLEKVGGKSMLTLAKICGGNKW
jgi:hypothetical protein